jgi:uncharacterized integral membrane protein (TIGR00698 family)
MAGPAQSDLPMIKREDTWAIIIGLGLTALISLAFFAGSAINIFKSMAVGIPTWSTNFGVAIAGLMKDPMGIIVLFLFFLVAFSCGMKVMGHDLGKFIPGFVVLFILSLLVTIFGSNTFAKTWQLETPLLALLVGIVFGNLMPLPDWFKTSLRTEFYVKTGIVLMGATLPFTIIMSAGPLAIFQAGIVSITTFFTIYLVATRVFKLDPRFGATLGAGGSICGVSGSIAVGGACRAEKEHVSIAISLVVVWAIIMIGFLPWAAKSIGMAPGPAGAWIGTSEFADAAGFAAAEQYNAAANLAKGDDRAVKAFTLMKVVGRDMWIGVWALMVAILSVTVWEKKKISESERVDYGEVWRRFPKFVIGFFAASILATLIIAAMDPKMGAAYTSNVLGPIKTLRGWTFTWTFLCIGFTTRFRELTSFGWKPLAAFTIGVLVNVPLGYYLSNVWFVDLWMQIK